MHTLRECFEKLETRLIGKINHFFDDYEPHLQSFVGTPAKVLEIGIHGGGSLELWRRYFGEAASIHGLDIDPRVCDRAPSDCQVHIGDQGNRSFLVDLATEYGPFDLIIDDGSHRMSDQITSFEALYALMSPTGVYICEDSFTSYWREYDGGSGVPDTFIGYAKNLVDELHAYWRLDDQVNPSQFTRGTAAIHFYSGAVVFQRKPVNRPEYLVRHNGNTQRISISTLKQAAGGHTKVGDDN